MKTADGELTGLRVLALLAGGRIERTRHIITPLETGIALRNWHVDVVCSGKDRPDYECLVGKSGTMFLWPSMLQSQRWESDDADVAETDRRLTEAERVTGVPIGRLALAGDTTVGTGFLWPMLDMNETSIGHRVIADNTEPFRIIRRLFQFADKTLEASSPDIVFAHEWAKPWLFAVWLAAQRRGIPCVAVRRSKIRSGHFFLTADPLLLNTAAAERAIAKRARGEPVSEAAKAAILDFRAAPKMIKHVAQKWSRTKRGNWFLWHARLAKTMADEVAKRFWPSRKSIGRAIRYNRKLIKAKTHSRFFCTFDNAKLHSFKYIYFSLHKESDLPLNYQAASWCDQRATVRLLASVLPNGYKLLVREHRYNYGLRPTTYYRELSRLPNVILIDAFEDQFKYIRHADMIVTENGSAGWEGLMLGRKVLTLSATFYDGAGLARRLLSHKNLGAEILAVLGQTSVADQAVYDHSLGSMIDAETETSIPVAWDNVEANFEKFSATLAALFERHSAEYAGQPPRRVEQR